MRLCSALKKAQGLPSDFGNASRRVQISLGFFEDVFIPSTALQEPSVLCVGCIRASSMIRFLTHCAAPCSDEAEHTWRWMYEGNVLFMDVDEEVRVTP